ncbi:MAG: DNA-deoxyinosine glycosylase [Planctomycetota bacterium]
MALARSFPPIFDRHARVLILGSMPGVASLEAEQYYAHPRNAFWPIMGQLFGAGLDLAYDDRCKRLTAAGVAVWDVLQQCDREGSLDAKIDRNSEVANDFGWLLTECPLIERVLFNGQKSADAFRRHALPTLEQAVVNRLTMLRLPSTSPAHAGRSFDQKLAAWREALA